MATLTLNLTDAQMTHLMEGANITNQDVTNYVLDLIDDDVNAKAHSLEDAERLLGGDVPPAFAGLDDLLNQSTAIGGGVRRSGAQISPYDDMGNCWLY